MPRWSPDGSQLGFYSARSGTFEVWTIQPDGSNLKQLTDAPYNAFAPTWSPDGSRIAYSEGDGKTHIFSLVVPWEEQTPQALPPMADGETFRVYDWSPDGKKLAGTTTGNSEGNSIVFYSVHDQKYQRFSANGDETRWMSDSRRLLYVWEGKIHLLDTMTGEHHEVLSVAPDIIGYVAIAKDDRSIYFSRREQEADIWMLTLDEKHLAAKVGAEGGI